MFKLSTFLWLAIMWSVLGITATSIYIVCDTVRFLFKFDSLKVDRQYFEIFEILENEESIAAFLEDFILQYPNLNEFKFIMNNHSLILMIFDWPHVLKLYHLSIHAEFENVLKEAQKMKESEN